jgi:hypothetical protein
MLRKMGSTEEIVVVVWQIYIVHFDQFLSLSFTLSLSLSVCVCVSLSLVRPQYGDPDHRGQKLQLQRVQQPPRGADLLPSFLA